MYVAIRRYRIDPASVDMVAQQINEGFIPIIKEAQGFLAYYALNAGDGEIATVSVFEDQAGAEESLSMAADWIRENLATVLTDPPQVTAGEVVAHELKLTKLGIRKVRE